LNELAKTMPRYMFYREDTLTHSATAITTQTSTYRLTLQEATTRLSPYTNELNKCIRKYIGSDKKRIALFLAQSLLEAARWQTHPTYGILREHGYGAGHTYGPFFGRGMMQITWAGAYRDYGEYKAMPNHTGAYIERLNNILTPRIISMQTHFTAGPGSAQIAWPPRYDPDIISEDIHYAYDSGGWFWVQKPLPPTWGGRNINNLADRPHTGQEVNRINIAVNGGGNARFERQAYSVYMLRYLTDNTDPATTVVVTWVYRHPANGPQNEQVTAHMEPPL
jgi:hypothetical protein